MLMDSTTYLVVEEVTLRRAFLVRKVDSIPTALDQHSEDPNRVPYEERVLHKKVIEVKQVSDLYGEDSDDHK